jgi:hypothetical protein
LLGYIWYRLFLSWAPDMTMPKADLQWLNFLPSYLAGPAIDLASVLGALIVTFFAASMLNNIVGGMLLSFISGLVEGKKDKKSDAGDDEWTAKKAKLLLSHLGERDEQAAPVIAKVFKPGNQAADPLRGFFSVELEEGEQVVQYQPDPDLRDTEQVPLLEEGGIEAFLQREVMPYADDAWYEPGSVKIGYEVSFTRYFYKPKPLRTLEEIRADILALEHETEGLLGEIVGGAR